MDDWGKWTKDKIFSCLFFLISHEENSEKRLYLAVIKPGVHSLGKTFSVNLCLIKYDSETTGPSGLKFAQAFYGIVLTKLALQRVVFAMLHYRNLILIQIVKLKSLGQIKWRETEKNSFVPVLFIIHWWNLHLQSLNYSMEFIH